MEDEIIVIDKIEEAEDNQGKTYLRITDKAGVTRNFKEGRSNLLTNKGHLLVEGKAIKLHFQDYKAPSGQIFPFVRDFEPVEDIFQEEATRKIQGQVKASREDSIEAQVAFKGMVELLIADKLNARQAQTTIEWATSRLHSVAQIVAKIEEAKGEKTTNNDDKIANRQQGKERASGPPGGEALELQPEEVPIKNVADLYKWIMSKDKDIKVPRVWIETNFGMSAEGMSDETLQALKKTIKTKMGW